MTRGNLGIHPKIAHLKNSMQHCEWELYLSVIVNNTLIRSQSFQFGRQRYDNLNIITVLFPCLMAPGSKRNNHSKI